MQLSIHGSELQDMAKRLLGKYEISPTNTYDLLSGTMCSPWYNLSGPIVHASEESADYTPEKLLDIYRKQTEFGIAAGRPATAAFRKKDSNDFVGLNKVYWSNSSCAVDFGGYFLRAGIKEETEQMREMLNNIRAESRKHGVMFESYSRNHNKLEQL